MTTVIKNFKRGAKLNIIDLILDLIYPPACISCNKILDFHNRKNFLCENCKFLFIKSPFCQTCGRSLSSAQNKCLLCEERNYYFEYNRGVFYYKDWGRKAVLNFKFKNQKNIAQYFAKLMLERFDEYFKESIDYIVPVPMFHKKIKKRGYNQSEVLAKILAKEKNIKLSLDLIKSIDTKRQSSLTAKEREENVKGVFIVKKGNNLKGKNILLIDDIFTTGSTVNNCAKVLKNSGASHVYSFSLTLTPSISKKVLQNS